MKSEIRYAYQTERLTVELCSLSTVDSHLHEQIIGILSPQVTGNLPGGWQGIRSTDKAKHWLLDRLAESEVLIVQHKAKQEVLGFIFLYKEDLHSAMMNYRFGYLLKQSAWGKGIGTELIQGLLKQLKQCGNVGSLLGGVELENKASIKVMGKCGFKLAPEQGDSNAVLFYEYRF